MLIKISDAAKRFKTQANLAAAIGISPQAITNRLRRSEYLTETQALKLNRKHPVITKELIQS
jgi:plasmid maintenance system antidote protein VapI